VSLISILILSSYISGISKISLGGLQYFQLVNAGHTQKRKTKTLHCTHTHTHVNKHYSDRILLLLLLLSSIQLSLGASTDKEVSKHVHEQNTQNTIKTTKIIQTTQNTIQKTQNKVQTTKNNKTTQNTIQTTQNTLHTRNKEKTTHKRGNGKYYCFMDGCKLLKGMKEKTAVQ
jgi:tRNA A37 N6-isopentenylltransferase MiaA